MIALVHRIVKFSGKYAAKIRIAYVFFFLKSACANAPVMLAMWLVNLLLEKRAALPDILAAAGAMIGFLAAQAVFQNLSDRFQSAAGYEIFADKRLELGEHLRRLPMGYFTEGNMGRISSILSVDMVFIEENSMNLVAGVVSDIFSQIILTAFLFLLHPLLGAAALAAETAAVLLAQGMRRSDLANSLHRQQVLEEMTDAVLEYTAGFAVSRSFGLTGERAAGLRQNFQAMTAMNLSFEERHMPWERALGVVYGLGTTLILGAGIYLQQQNALPVGHFIGLLLFLFHIFAPIRHLYEGVSRMSIMQTALDKIERLLAEEVLPDTGRESLPERAEAEIEFRQVSFAYGQKEVLHQISFAVKPGQTLALIGQSGSGKTTVANLLARFWDIQSGEILLRGRNIKTLPMETLLGHLSVVFQRVYLFRDTVYQNIVMGRPEASREEVVEAAKKARCYDFIMRLPYGFDTIIGEGGSSLSGGEAQRISIARGILKNAPVIILDEATASIDADNEYYIRQALAELCRDKTVIIIAHRLNTIRSADQILLLEDGRICAGGSHQELMGSSEKYRRLTALQEQAGGWNQEEIHE